MTALKTVWYVLKDECEKTFYSLLYSVAIRTSHFPQVQFTLW